MTEADFFGKSKSHPYLYLEIRSEATFGKPHLIISLQTPFGEIGTPKSRNRHIRKVPVKGKGRAVLAYNSLPQCEPESRKANKVRHAP